jgi:hypothetical protein
MSKSSFPKQPPEQMIRTKGLRTFRSDCEQPRAFPAERKIAPLFSRSKDFLGGADEHIFEMTATDTPAEFPSQLKIEPAMLPSGQPVLRVSIHVEASKLPFQKIADRKVERLIFITALFDSQDHFVSGVQGVMDLRLKDSTFATLSGSGVTARLTLDAPSGQYRLRQVVQETSSGHLNAQTQPLQIH